MSTEPKADTAPSNTMTDKSRYYRNYAAYLLSGIESDQPMPAPTADGLDPSESTAVRQALVALPVETLRSHAEPDDWNCTTCGFIHPPCTMCAKRTECSTEEEGQPYTTCHRCDLELAGKDS